MATCFSILAWEILWTEEPGRLHSMGSQRVRHNLATKQQQHSLDYFKITTPQGEQSFGPDVNQKQNEYTFDENLYFTKSVLGAENLVINKSGVRCKNKSTSLWSEKDF